MNTPSSASNICTSAIPSTDNLVSDGCIDLSRLSSEAKFATDESNELVIELPENQVDENVAIQKLDSGQSVNGTCIDDSKSLNEIIGVLKPDHIRWFYKNISNKQWLEFNGYDSLRIERCYQQLPYECKYNNDSAKDQDTSDTSSLTIDALKSNSDNITSPVQDEFSPPVYDGTERVVVRGGMYEVDLLKRICFSIFWPGEFYSSVSGVSSSWYFHCLCKYLLLRCNILESLLEIC